MKSFMTEHSLTIKLYRGSMVIIQVKLINQQ